jgi:hypothetical protein
MTATSPQGTAPNDRELILLSPYQYPAQHALTLATEDMAGWMNAWTALWHPAVLWGAKAPPRVDVPYDHETPQAGRVYAVPESPPMILPDDWEQRVRTAGATLVKASADRTGTLQTAVELYAGLKPASLPQRPTTNHAVDESGDAGHAGEQPAPDQLSVDEPSPSAEEIHARLLKLDHEQVKPFFAIGLGYLLQSALSQGMEHQNLLEVEAFWDDVQQAITALAGLPTTPPELPPAADLNQAGYYPSYGSHEPGSYPTDYEGPAVAGPSEATNSADMRQAPQAESAASSDDNLAQDYSSDGGQNDSNSGPGDAYSDGQSSIAGTTALEPSAAHLHSAARRLLTAREVLYPVSIFLLDLHLLDETRLGEPWRASFHAQKALNILASSALLEKLHRDQPEQFQALRERVERDEVQVCGGCYLEREEALLPLESQFWNLLKGQAVAKELLGRPLEVFARKRFGAHPQLPQLLTSTGLHRALFLTFDDSAFPQFHTPVVSLTSPDGKQVEAYVRPPQQADSIEALFNLGHALFKTIREDHSATLAFLHRGQPAAPWYEDFVSLARFGPIFGDWVTFSRYFNQVMAGEYVDARPADDYHFDYLSERVGVSATDRRDEEMRREGDEEKIQNTSPGPLISSSPHPLISPTPWPVSGMGHHVRLRRRLDTCWTLAAMERGLAGRVDPLRIDSRLAALEDKVETAGPHFLDGWDNLNEEINETEQQILGVLADRLLSRATGQEPGYLVFNPCGYSRRVVVELDRQGGLLKIQDPVKACQVHEDRMHVVADVPALGFAWLPRSGPAEAAAPTQKIRMADEHHVRNEFFEAQIDSRTGGLSSLADRRNPVSRLGQRLVFNPGSSMKVDNTKVTSTGPALGEVITEGTILGEQQQILARYRQRFRAWLGRPVLELRIEIKPEQPAAGYPWHAYFGCRFAWGDERMMVLRGVNGTSYITTHPRPQTPDFLELRAHRQNTVIFPQGLPFLQRQELRMVDVILMPQGETATTFDLAIGMDREVPMLSAQGLVTPVPVIATRKGPPHIGAKGWLFHLDRPNLLLTSMRPGGREAFHSDATGEKPRDLFDAVTVRLQEIGTQVAQAQFRCVRNPRQAALLNARGERLVEGFVNGDAVNLDLALGDFAQVQIEFS